MQEDAGDRVIMTGRYNNASKAIRAGLRLLEENEGRIAQLRSAIIEGELSGTYANFDAEEHLKQLKAKHQNS